MTLLAAPMLAGLMLASVPIIIHLWNRRQFRLVEWAPMKYIRLTVQTNRRRMRIEQLLLLAVRILVVALLFVALARPAFSRSGAGGWLASRSRASRVIVIDDSMSMGYVADRQSAFDRAKDAAARIVRAIGSQDDVTVVLSSRADQPLVKEGGREDLTRALSRMEKFSPADSACDWAAVLKQVDGYISGASHLQRELILITDLRRSGWGAGVSAQTAKWAGQTLDVKVVDVGSRVTENTVLARFEQEEPLALPGVPLKLRASVRNDTAADVRGASATLEIDGQARPLVLPDLPAGRTTEVPLTVTLAKPGEHVLRLSLPDDALKADNTRWLAVGVRPEVKVAVIDGQISSRPFESSSDFLQLALTAGADLWQVHRRADSEWQKAAASDAQLSGADVIVLSNVPSLSPQQTAVLERLVSAGAGLMIFGGEQIDPAIYNQLLYRDGAGLLPAKLDRAGDTTPGGLMIEGVTESPLSPMAKLAPEALARIKAKKFLTVKVDENGKDRNTRVLARWNDSEAHPAVIEKRFGRGRVVLWTITADRQWSDWPVDPTYVLALRSAASAIVRAERAGTNFTAGEAIAYPLDEGEVVQSPTISGPDQATDQQAVTVAGQVLRSGVTSRAGRYTLNWKNAAGAEMSRTLCASFNPLESNLQPIGEAEIKTLLAPLSASFMHWGAAREDEPLADRGREIWRNVILAVLALAVVETMLATWVSRER